MSKIEGVSKGAVVVENNNGGRQSDLPYAFTMLPSRALFAAAKVAKYGAEKYGETLEERNYTKIEWQDHLDHMLSHVFALLAGDDSDEHFEHALVRMMFAYETYLMKQEQINGTD